ncbi:hypothetical protein SAE02_53840 [Skermanella aerolata]|uniref:DUF2325 domain-containing protein n=1 Tax=Skermanella aerolata TaxID=393310 RepID=A0A512DXS0_9PROT|nr:DUF2325 domain-containing protein [Skermanella aerolata]KJB92261.1 hypothetical protein N826_16245 [Skermanella aerolata KACC 11604]GEO41236.1 hypothetical protein SAE02_53840 [Skermanella aerolata]
MCEQCEAEHSVLSKSARSRRKLWEVPSHLHCSVIGTCLSMDDLRKLTRKGGMRISDDATDYCVHSYFVREAGTETKLARMLHKMLDDKHAVDIKRFSAVASDAAAIEALWEKAMDNGRVAGAYWAVLSLRCAPSELVTSVYGQVHMLSHVLGGYNRNAIQRLAAAEKQVADLTRHRDAALSAKLELERAKEKRICELENELCRLRASGRSNISVTVDTRETIRLKERLARAEQRISAERERRRAAETRLEQLQLLDLDVPMERPSQSAETPAPAQRPVVDVAGQCVLYVGGRQALVPHIRSAIERRQGRLLHHDGGLEQAPKILETLVTQADMVFCPLDCISHSACLRVKRLCQRLDKPFMVLRTSGASSLVRALRSDEAGVPH